MMRPFPPTALALAAAALLLGGCTLAGPRAQAARELEASTRSAGYAGLAGRADRGALADLARAPRAPAQTLAEAAQPAPAQPRAPRQLIHTGRLRLAVGETEAARSQAKRLSADLGGYVQSIDDAQIILRIPAQRWDEALEKAAEIGRILERHIEAQDVTEEVLDLRLRLKNAQALRERLEELMKRAEDVKAALEVEKELARVRETIERIEGRLQVLESKISFSTLTLIFVQAARAPRAAGRLPFFWLRELGIENLLELGGAR